MPYNRGMTEQPEYRAGPGTEDRHGEMTGAISVNMVLSMPPVAIWAVFLTEIREFYLMAIMIGLVQGGVQGMSRSLYASLIPASQSGEFFGFYNMLTKLAHVLGPMSVGIGALLSDDPKFVLITLLPLFIIGTVLLTRVTDTAAD